MNDVRIQAPWEVLRQWMLDAGFPLRDQRAGNKGYTVVPNSLLEARVSYYAVSAEEYAGGRTGDSASLKETDLAIRSLAGVLIDMGVKVEVVIGKLGYPYLVVAPGFTEKLRKPIAPPAGSLVDEHEYPDPFDQPTEDADTVLSSTDTLDIAGAKRLAAAMRRNGIPVPASVAAISLADRMRAIARDALLEDDVQSHTHRYGARLTSLRARLKEISEL